MGKDSGRATAKRRAAYPDLAGLGFRVRLVGTALSRCNGHEYEE